MPKDVPTSEQPSRAADPASDSVDGERGVALYIRVSTNDQSLEGQERELRQEATSRGWTVVAVYKEKASANGKSARHAYDRLIRDAGRPRRPWRHLLVWALDRFSRDETFTRATQTILDLERTGVRFHSLKEPTLDTPDDGRPNLGRDGLLALLPVIASFESRRRSERVRVAMREIREGRRRTRSGRPPGRPRRLTPEKVQQILRFRSQGLPWSTIVQRVGLPSGTCRYAFSMAKRAAVENSGMCNAGASSGSPEGPPTA